MDRKQLKNLSLLNRSGGVYILIAIVLLMSVDFRHLEEQYSTYLSWKFAAENFQDNKAGVLYYESMTRLFPLEAGFFAKLGICYYKLGEHDKATAAYSKAVVLDLR